MTDPTTYTRGDVSSLRHYAAAAMSALLAKGERWPQDVQDSMVARRAWIIAELMLEEEKKRGPG